MNFTCNGRPLDIPVRHMVVAGWTGRDAAAQGLDWTDSPRRALRCNR